MSIQKRSEQLLDPVTGYPIKFHPGTNEPISEAEADREALAQIKCLDRFFSGDSAETLGLYEPDVNAEDSWIERELAELDELTSELSAPPIIKKLWTKLKDGRFAPNCFGSPSLHDPSSAECGKCKFVADCKNVASQAVPERTAHSAAIREQGLPRGTPSQIAANCCLVRGYHWKKFAKALKRRHRLDAESKRNRRANPSKKDLIERQAKRLLTALVSARRPMATDKRWQQIRGRENVLVDVWVARQQARLALGRAPSDGEVAERFEKWTGRKFSRHQARSYRILFDNMSAAWRHRHNRPAA